MGMAPSVPQVRPPSAGQVGNQWSQLLQTLYSGLPGQVSSQQEFQPQFISNASTNLNNAAGGVLGTYLNSIIPGLNTGANAIAGGNVNTVAANGPGATAAIGSLSPAAMGINDLELSNATAQLKAGSQLPAAQVDQTLNAVNQNWASRGLGGSPANELDAALNLYLGGNTQLQQGEAAGQNAMTGNFNYFTGPGLSLITPSLTTPGTALATTGTSAANLAAGSAANLPSEQDAESLMNLVYNSQASGNIAQANVQEAQNQAEAQFWSGIIGGGMGAM